MVDDDWLVFWGLLPNEAQKNMLKHQKNNHFPGCFNSGRKDKLWIHISAAKRKFPLDYNFMPNTLLM
jgi:tubulin polyglutamylase TTLL4